MLAPTIEELEFSGDNSLRPRMLCELRRVVARNRRHAPDRRCASLHQPLLARQAKNESSLFGRVIPLRSHWL